MEAEILGPRPAAAPGDSLIFREGWFLFEGIAMRAGEQRIELFHPAIAPRIRSLFLKVSSPDR